MGIIKAVLGRLSYANIAATLALVVALGGTAYAADLAKDSVRSKQIKNNTVTTMDVKDQTLQAGDLAANTLTGGQVNETTLGTVPNAGKLGGVPAADYARAPLAVFGDYAGGTGMELVVPGYGRYVLGCDDNETSDVADDLAFLGVYSLPETFGDDVVTTMLQTRDSNGNDATTDYSIDNALQFSTSPIGRMKAELLVRRADGTKSLRVMAYGWDDTTTVGCTGQIDAEILR